MADKINEPSDKERPPKYYPRSLGFSIFDFYKNPGWRLGTGSAVKNPLWYGAMVASLALGLWVVWADIASGVSIVRIAVIWLVVSGVAFYFLIRLQQTLFWASVVAAASAVLTLTLQFRQWLLTDHWPGWVIKDLPLIHELLGENPSGLIATLAAQSALLGLITAALLFLILTKITKFKGVFKGVRHL